MGHYERDYEAEENEILKERKAMLRKVDKLLDTLNCLVHNEHLELKVIELRALFQYYLRVE